MSVLLVCLESVGAEGSGAEVVQGTEVLELAHSDFQDNLDTGLDNDSDNLVDKDCCDTEHWDRVLDSNWEIGLDRLNSDEGGSASDI